MTLGEKRMRVTFSPSASTTVDQIKQKAAELIDLIESLRGSAMVEYEHNRLVSLAQTALEEAAMWAVKAATAR